MKYAIFLLVFLFTSILTYGQTVSFRYDNSGNRTSRTTITLKSTASSEDETKPEESFSDQVGEHGIVIYPNPVENELTVEIQGLDEKTDASIALFDQEGRLVLKQDKATNSNLLSLSHLSPGSYFMTIRVGSDSTKWKIVKE
jgi:YD repeat-containing protein